MLFSMRFSISSLMERPAGESPVLHDGVVLHREARGQGDAASAVALRGRPRFLGWVSVVSIVLLASSIILSVYHGRNPLTSELPRAKTHSCFRVLWSARQE